MLNSSLPPLFLPFLARAAKLQDPEKTCRNLQFSDPAEGRDSPVFPGVFERLIGPNRGQRRRVVLERR
jgi:hypothetical protein